MKRAKSIAGIIAGLVCYGGYVVALLGLAAFVFGTGNFLEWGQDGRGITVFIGICGGPFWAMACEIGELRKTLAAILLSDDKP